MKVESRKGKGRQRAEKPGPGGASGRWQGRFESARGLAQSRTLREGGRLGRIQANIGGNVHGVKWERESSNQKVESRKQKLERSGQQGPAGQAEFAISDLKISDFKIRSRQKKFVAPFMPRVKHKW